VKSLTHSLLILALLTAGAGLAGAQDEPPAAAAPAAAAPAEAVAAAAAPGDAGAQTRRKARRKLAKADDGDQAKPIKGQRARRLALLKEAEERAAEEAAAAAEGKIAPAPQPATAAPAAQAVPTQDADLLAVNGGIDGGLDGGLDTLPAVGLVLEAAAQHEAHGVATGESPQGEGEHGEHDKAAGAHGEAGEHGGFKVGTFVLQLVNFGCLLFLLIYFGGRAMNKSLRARHEQLKTEVSEAARLRDEATQKAAAQEKRLSELEKEIATLRAGLRQDADREQARLIESAKERAKRIQEDMRFQLDQQVKEAEMLLRAEVASASVKLAEELTRKAVDTQDERRLAQEFVAGFGGPNAPAGGAR
jgi:F-type H+-transporting ATPase subunit b